MRAALDDERRAQAFYEAVIDRFGQRRPFSMIIEAERRHEALLLRLLERYQVTVPARDSASRDLEVPPTFAEACRRAVELEKQNVAMYNRFLPFIRRPRLRGDGNGHEAADAGAVCAAGGFRRCRGAADRELLLQLLPPALTTTPEVSLIRRG